jgi:hypothetical protein
MLAREGMRNPVVQALASAKSYSTPHAGGFDLRNLNQMLWRYADADGNQDRLHTGRGTNDRRLGHARRHRVYVAAMRAMTFSRRPALLDWRSPRTAGLVPLTPWPRPHPRRR